jgi:hypothetical protein
VVLWQSFLIAFLAIVFATYTTGIDSESFSVLLELLWLHVFVLDGSCLFEGTVSFHLHLMAQWTYCISSNLHKFTLLKIWTYTSILALYLYTFVASVYLLSFMMSLSWVPGQRICSMINVLRHDVVSSLLPQSGT